MIIASKFFEHFFGLLTLQVIFIFLCHNIIIPGQGYLEYIPNQSSIDYSKTPILLIIITILSLYFSIDRGSKTEMLDFFLYSYLFMLVLPYASFFLIAEFKNFDKIIYGLSSVILFSNLVILFNKNTLKINGTDIFFKIIISLMIIYFLIYALYVFINNPSINIFDYYKNRRIYVSSGFPFLGYITPWLSNVICPVLIAYGLFNKKNSYILLGISLSIIVFSLPVLDLQLA